MENGVMVPRLLTPENGPLRTALTMALLWGHNKHTGTLGTPPTTVRVLSRQELSGSGK